MARPLRVLAASIALAVVGVVVAPASATAATPDFVFVPGSPDNPYDSFEFGGVWYVAANDPGLGQDVLYAFDGTNFTNAIPANTLDSMDDFVEFGGDLYFSGYDGVDWSLYRWDGTTVSIVPGSPVEVHELVLYDGDLYFSADGAVNPSVLWRWDGTTLTEVTGVGIAPPQDIAFLTVYQGELAMLGSDGTTDRLYVWDGPGDAFALAAGSGPVPTCPGGLAVFAGLLVFDACNSGVPKLTTWNGSAFATVTAGSPPVQSDLTDGSGQLPGALFFVGTDGSNILAYVFSGTSVAPVSTNTVIPGTTHFEPFGGDMFFIGVNASSAFAFYRWSGGTLTELVSADPAGPFIQAINGSLYVVADDGVNFGMWRYTPPTPLTPLLPATGVDGMPWLVGAALLLLAGGAVVARDRRGIRR